MPASATASPALSPQRGSVRTDAADRFRSCHLPFTVSACCSTFLTAAVSDVPHASVVPTPCQRVVLPRMDDDFGHEAVLLARQHDLRRHQRLAEPALELCQSGLDEPSESRGDFDLSAGQQ